MCRAESRHDMVDHLTDVFQGVKASSHAMMMLICCMLSHLSMSSAVISGRRMIVSSTNTS
jgi:hypothetical protein